MITQSYKRICAGFALVALLAPISATAQHSVARQWNEALLDAIRVDYARPTVHARNLFHTSIAMYDTWTAYQEVARPYLLGQTVGNFTCPFDGVPAPADIQAAREEAISYAMYRLLSHRFANSPNADTTLPLFDALMMNLGYDTSFESIDYSSGSAAALGNYIAQCMINFGHQDGANEQGGYENLFYEPVNPTLIPVVPGNPNVIDPNRWQALTLDTYIDQAGNVLPRSTPPFLSPEWGIVSPFALRNDALTIYERDGHDYWVYHDPDPPPHLDTLTVGGESDEFKWGFELVSIWSSHLDPADGVMWDISPGSIGNIPELPQTLEEYHDFFNRIEGGDPSLGHVVNPRTGQPYTPQLVPRGDYARVLAEFWADGPASETPPGHWFTILNYVNDHPLFEKRFQGVGPILDDLEWDVKAYFILAGAVHDAAVSAWGIKGWYDYCRPIAAIRCMADRGQATDSGLPNYDPGGIRLVPGFIELVEAGDPLAGDESEHVGKIKVYSWRGPKYIRNPDVDVAGVDWILAENWWPYQRPTFVTPPFAGFISGHSTFSRAAAVVMELLTGDEFFPGGMGEFHAPMNEFLVFEDGPSVDLTLQWATYRDASDQTSLSRIWGGIHPPADDIPGRRIGEIIGADAFNLAASYFDGAVAITIAAFDALLVENGVALSWRIEADESLDGFQIYRATGDDPTWLLLTWQPLDVSARSYVDESAQPGERYRYRLALTGSESGVVWSLPVEIQWAPLKPELAQNYPNPFNPSTTVSFALPAQGHVRLAVYDVAGNLVNTLVDGQRSAGRHVVDWHGLDEKRRRVASGVYLYRIEAGRFVETKRMMLLK